MTLTRSILVVLSLFVFSALNAQIDKQGLPLTWNDNINTVVNNSWVELPSFNLLEILAQDNLDQEDKVMPFRFAYASPVSYTPLGSGRWTNYPNGDRVWILALESDQAISLNVVFSNFNIPSGARLYVYNEGRSDFVGPLTSKNNRQDAETTLLPLKGRRIIIEYYEPFASRGAGTFEISHVVQGYRDIPALAEMIAACMEPAHVDGAEKAMQDLAAASSLMIVDRGQRITTGVLLNNTLSDGTPLMLTSANALFGDPESWVFVFGLNYSDCSIQGNIECWDKALSGAKVLRVDPSTGMALLELVQKPKTEWGVFYAGWTKDPAPIDHFFSFQHALGLPLSFSSFAGSSDVIDWFGLDVMKVDAWSRGSTFPGSIGSPLFNAGGEVVGAFIGGGANCANNESDYFGLIQTAWPSFAEFLNPAGMSKTSMEGFYPIFLQPEIEAAAETKRVIVFPNPASDFLYFQNQSDEIIQRVIFTDMSGRMVERSRPNLPILDVNFLPGGVYDVQVILETSTLRERIIIRR